MDGKLWKVPTYLWVLAIDEENSLGVNWYLRGIHDQWFLLYE